ncbi:MAG: ATPase V [Bacteroidales bacterium]|nr:ATPase V [Bacteroidales bacterium]
MVEKMTKYSFVLLSDESEKFLESLQELGVVDISRSSKPVDHHSAALLERAGAVRRTISTLEGMAPASEADAEPCIDAVERLAELNAALEKLGSRKADLARELKLRLPWGSFSTDTIESLQQSGCRVSFHCLPRSKYDSQWEQQYAVNVISDEGDKRYFVVFTPEGEEPFPIAENARPKGDAAECEAQLCEVEREIETAQGEIARLCSALPSLRSEYRSLMNGLDRYLAADKAEKAAEGYVSVYVGYAPRELDATLAAAFDAMDVFYEASPATGEDNPPIKLRNGRFSRLFECITGMYGMPVYDEFDPTPILSVFFLLFFAMCMGDAGYGLILVLFGIAINRKWVKISMFENIGTLISVLGGATLVIGVVLGTAFGMDLYQASWVPAPIKGCMLKGELLGYDIQMVAALAIGVFHLCLAMTVKAILYTKRFGFKEAISSWGWLVLIVGGIMVAALAFGGILAPEATRWAIILVAVVSALGIFIFNKVGRNPLINIGAGLWDTYGMVTGLMGDVLSYIRLYALGLAGGMLGNAFNELGQMVLGDGGLLWIPFVLILLFGHILNLLMSCLGAFVHPLRLNFVEYFKNAGFEGKGAFYRPLTKEIINQ